MNRFPLYNENDFAIAIETNLDIDKEHADLIAKGMKRVIGLFAEDKHNREILKVAPDLPARINILLTILLPRRWRMISGSLPEILCSIIFRG